MAIEQLKVKTAKEEADARIRIENARKESLKAELELERLRLERELLKSRTGG